MLKKIVFYIIGVLIYMPLYSQDWDNYKPLKSSGQLPKEITSSASSKFKKLEQQVKNSKSKNKKEKKTFYLESTYSIDELMKSGRVLYNDPIGDYVNKVADKLLEHDKRLREKLRFYVVQSAGVNAFATDRGSIFVNIGLLSRLENEAQLAFILAHEIVHYEEKHNMDGYIQSIDVDKLATRKKSSYDGLLEKSNYSQELEREADEHGMEIFEKSAYSTSSIAGIYDILATTHTSYEDVEFDLGFLNKYGIEIPKEMLLDSVNVIEKYEENEELSTHPSINERRQTMMDRFGEKEDGKSNFLVGEDDFNKIKKMAQYELCNILVENHSFPAAIYHAYLLQNDNTNNAYLDNIVVKSIYGMAQYANAEEKELIPGNPENIQGNMQQIFHVLHEMDAFDLSSIAVLYTWNYAKNNPENKAAQLRAEDMIKDLTKFYVDRAEKFYKGEDETYKDKFTYGLLDNLYKSDKDYRDIVKKGSKERNYYKKFEYKLEYFERKTKTYKKEQKKEKIQGGSLGLKSTIFVNPLYIRYKESKKKNPYKFIESEKKQGEFIGRLKEQAEDLNFRHSILDINSINRKTKAEEFNQIVTLEKWTNEFTKTSFMNMIPSNHEDLLDVVNLHGSSTITYTGVIDRTDKLGLMGAINIIISMSYLQIPAIYHFIIPGKNNTLYYWITIDVNEMEVLHEEMNNLKMKARDGLIDAHLYWMISQMKRK